MIPHLWNLASRARRFHRFGIRNAEIPEIWNPRTPKSLRDAAEGSRAEPQRARRNALLPLLLPLLLLMLLLLVLLLLMLLLLVLLLLLLVLLLLLPAGAAAAGPDYA